MENQHNTQQRLTRRERAERERQKVCRLLAGLLALAIVTALAGSLIAKDRSFSEEENRVLTQKLEVSWSGLWDGSLFREMEDYLADQFVGRDQWISLKLQEDRLMGRKESNGVYLGKEGYLMEIPSDPEEENVQRNLEAIGAFAQRYDTLNMAMLVAPNSVTVLDNYLPANAPVRDQAAELKRIREALPQRVSFIDVTEALRAHREEGVFYRTDHHWTSLGAYYAFQAAAPTLGIETVKAYQPHVVSTTFEGTLASQSGCHERKDTIEVYEPENPENEFYVIYDDTQEKSRSLFVSKCLEDKDQYTVFFGGNHPKITIRTTSDNGKRLLIFKDSYANSFVQFLTPYYEEIVLVDPRYYYDNAGALISGEGITDVLFLYNLDTYLGNSALADTLETAQPKETADDAVQGTDEVQ